MSTVVSSLMTRWAMFSGGGGKLIEELGIDADFTVHVAPALLAEKDGRMLELLKVAHRELIVLPRRAEHYPNRELLAERFERFSK